MVNLQVTFITLESICFLINIPSLAWHIRSRNVAGIALITYLQLMMIKAIVDAAVWGGSNYLKAWDGKIWCDIMVRIHLGSNIGCSTSIFTITLNLLLILLANDLTEKWFNHPKFKLFIELFCCLIFPLIIMGISYFAQDFRYRIYQTSGCRFPLVGYTINILVYRVWVIFWSFLSLVLSSLTLLVFFKKRKNAKNILKCTNSGLSLRKFSKLLIFCILIDLVMFPISIVSMVISSSGFINQFTSSDIHDKLFWGSILRLPHDATQDVDTWVYISVSIVTFILFGLGDDAIAMYVDFLKFLPGGETLINKLSNFKLLRVTEFKEKYLQKNEVDLEMYQIEHHHHFNKTSDEMIVDTPSTINGDISFKESSTPVSGDPFFEDYEDDIDVLNELERSDNYIDYEIEKDLQMNR